VFVCPNIFLVSWARSRIKNNNMWLEQVPIGEAPRWVSVLEDVAYGRMKLEGLLPLLDDPTMEWDRVYQFNGFTRVTPFGYMMHQSMLECARWFVVNAASTSFDVRDVCLWRDQDTFTPFDCVLTYVVTHNVFDWWEMLWDAGLSAKYFRVPVAKAWYSEHRTRYMKRVAATLLEIEDAMFATTWCFKQIGGMWPDTSLHASSCIRNIGTIEWQDELFKRRRRGEGELFKRRRGEGDEVK